MCTVDVGVGPFCTVAVTYPIRNRAGIPSTLHSYSCTNPLFSTHHSRVCSVATRCCMKDHPPRNRRVRDQFYGRICCQPRLVILLMLFLVPVLWWVHRAWRQCQNSILGCGPKYNQAVPTPDPEVQRVTHSGDWRQIVSVLHSARKHVIVDARFGLGNRLRAVASAMAVAAAADRPLLVVWVPDGHCNCSVRELLEPPLPFSLSDVEIPMASLPVERFQAFNYMPGEAGSVKREWVRLDHARHLFVKTAYRIAHERGEWPFAARKLRELRPRRAILQGLQADSSMIGLHVRGVVDAISNYGDNGTASLSVWRERGRWPKFVERMSLEPESRKFYLAADSAAAFDGLSAAYPGRIISNARALAQCRRGRCDLDRSCTAMGIALTDILNLARTRRLLGSGYSSFSEVARFYGAANIFGTELPFEAAGIDFG